MAGTLTTLSATLKIDYQSGIRDAVVNETWWYKNIKKDSSKWQGSIAYNAIRVAGTTGVDARPAGGKTPDAGNQTVVNQQIPVKYIYGKIQVDDVVIEASKTDKGAFIKALDLELENLVPDLHNKLNRMFCSDGTGILAWIKGIGGASGTQSVQYAGAASGAILGKPGTLNLRKNQYVIIGSPADIASGAAYANVRQISSITDRNTVVLDSTVTTTTGDVIVGIGSGGLASQVLAVKHSTYNNEMQGFYAAAGQSGTYHALSFTDYPHLRMNVLTNPAGAGVARSLTRDLWDEALDKIHFNGGKCDMVVADISMRKQIKDMLEIDDTFVHNDANKVVVNKTNSLWLDNGAGGLTEIQFVLRDFPFNKIAFITKRAWTYYTLTEGRWFDLDGNVFSRIEGEAAVEALYEIYGNLSCWNPSWNTSLEDIYVSLPAA